MQVDERQRRDLLHLALQVSRCSLGQNHRALQPDFGEWQVLLRLAYKKAFASGVLADASQIPRYRPRYIVAASMGKSSSSRRYRHGKLELSQTGIWTHPIIGPVISAPRRYNFGVLSSFTCSERSTSHHRRLLARQAFYLDATVSQRSKYTAVTTVTMYN